MAKIYVTLIKEGKWTIEQVPEKWRQEVQKILNV